MQPSYPESPSDANTTAADFQAAFETIARESVGQLLQIYLDQEVDELLQRARYGRRAAGMPAAYRDGHDEPRSLTTGLGKLKVARPRVRGI